MSDTNVLERCFNKLAAAAAKGERCPQNDGNDIHSMYVVMLALQGRIRIHIHGRNFRVVVILDGPQAGKWTAADPSGSRLWKIIDQNGRRRIARDAQPRRSRTKFSNSGASEPAARRVGPSG